MFKYYFDVHRGEEDLITEFLIEADTDNEAWEKLHERISSYLDVFMILITEKS